jgi:hypothetical protein
MLHENPASSLSGLADLLQPPCTEEASKRNNGFLRRLESLLQMFIGLLMSPNLKRLEMQHTHE